MRIWMAAAAVLVAGCRKESVKPAAAPEAAPVQAAVMSIQPEPFTATVGVTGTLVSRTQVDIKAQTTGRVVRFDKEEERRRPPRLGLGLLDVDPQADF